ncbi:RND superfamily putative drug exporter [Georgenia soli]|uniref:RND superfamily putative drug exporter n=1 Tax=Georgenia soli TaxID=638953 RepID=A0A2A9ESW6_9MICO|nr:MMPL family transporter [Georgenia soli]PFG41352.1 RND superfamily putative drug exporter [Georgenia soli]
MTRTDLPETTSGARHRSARSGVVRGLVVLAVLVAWLAVGAFGGMAQGSLSEVQENDSAAFLPAGAESTRADQLAREFSGTESLPALVVLRPTDGGKLSPEDLAAGQELAAAVPRVELPGAGPLEDHLTGPVVAVPSEDGEALLIPVSLDGDSANTFVGENEERLVNVVVDQLRVLVDDQLGGTGLEAWVTGPAGFVADLVAAFGGIDGILLGVALVVVLVILFVVYRSPSLPFTVLLTAVFALCAAALVIKPLAGGGVLLLNGQSQGILSILVIGAATDYSLLLVARYREELTRHEHPADAMRAAWRASLEPIAASAGTVIVGLLCLLLSDLGSNASLGPVAAIGIASAVLAALTLLPALLLVAGRRSRFVFWPRMPHYVGDDGVRAASGDGTVARPGIWERVAGFVGSHARPVWVVTALVLLAGAAFVPTLRADGTSDTDIYLKEVESVAGEEVLAEHFDEGTVQPAVVITAEENAAEVLKAAEGVDGVLSAQLVADPAGAPGGAAGGQPGGDAEAPAGATGGQPGGGEVEAPAGVTGGQPGASATGEPLVVDGNVQIRVVTADAAETQQALVTVADLRAAVHEADPDALVGGAAAQRLDTQETAAQDLRTIIPVVLVAIFLMLVLLLRSVVAPLVLLAANVLSFGATMGLSALVFNHVLGFPGADATVPLYGFVFLVALGIDYSIFLMTRVREESLQHGTRNGVGRGLAVTGGVITSAGLVLAATFSALAVIPLLFLVQLAFIVAAGVLVDTFVVRTLLVPGAIHDLGRVAWWPWQRRVPQD